MSDFSKPIVKPKNPYFGSGPCAKHATWQIKDLEKALISRSHRSKVGTEKIQEVLLLTRDVLNIPPSYQVGLISGSATAAMECLMWNLLGNRPVDVFAWDVFGERWAKDIMQELKIAKTSLFKASSRLDQARSHHDIVFTWNATTSGICVPQGTTFVADTERLILCDATSAAFAVPLPWDQLDATAFSWQKGLGGEAGQGLIVLSPRALNHLRNYCPSWPIPYLFKLSQDFCVKETLFQGQTLNTVSLIVLEEAAQALKWAQKKGGIQALYQQTLKNFQAIESWVKVTSWIDFYESRVDFRSPTSVCLKFVPSVSWPWIEDFCALLEQEQVGYDLKNHRAAMPSLRIWAGPTREENDLQILFLWLTWAYNYKKNLHS